MSHIRDRLIQLKNDVENTENGAYFSKNNISKIVELLLVDLEQDEKKTAGFRSVRDYRRLKCLMRNAIWLLMEDFAGWHTGRTKKSGFLQNAQIVKIKLIGQTLWLGCHFQNCIRRTDHDYIRIRIYHWSYIRSGWHCMCSDYVRQAPPRRIKQLKS